MNRRNIEAGFAEPINIDSRYPAQKDKLLAMLRANWRLRIQRLEPYDWNVLDGNIGAETFRLDVEERDDDTIETSMRLKSLLAKKQQLLDEVQQNNNSLKQNVETLEELTPLEQNDEFRKVKIITKIQEIETIKLTLGTVMIKIEILDREIKKCRQRILARCRPEGRSDLD